MPTPERKRPFAGARARSTDQLIQTLQAEIQRLEGRPPRDRTAVISSGSPAFDRLLPNRGFRGGTLVEWLVAGKGSGGGTLVFSTAREAAREGGAVVVLDQAREFYPPAAIRLGIALEHLLVVRARSQADNLWALDQSLRCPAVAAVVAWPETFDAHAFRRLQLAAEQGGGLGLLVRSRDARHEASCADVRVLVEPQPAPETETSRRLRVRLLRGGGKLCDESVELEIDDETSLVHPVVQRAGPANRPRTAGA